MIVASEEEWRSRGTTVDAKNRYVEIVEASRMGPDMT